MIYDYLSSFTRSTRAILVQFLQHETCGKATHLDNTDSAGGKKRHISHATRQFPRGEDCVHENEREEASSKLTHK